MYMASSDLPVGGMLWLAASRWRTAVDRALAPAGMTHATFQVVAALFVVNNARRAPLQRELAEHIGIEPLYLSKLVRVAERDGLLIRRSDPADARAQRLTLTPIGRVRTRTAIGIVQRVTDEFLAPIGGRASTDADALRETLRRVLTQTSAAPPEIG